MSNLDHRLKNSYLYFRLISILKTKLDMFVQYLSPENLFAKIDTPLLQFIEEGKEFSQKLLLFYFKTSLLKNSSQDLTYFI